MWLLASLALGVTAAVAESNAVKNAEDLKIEHLINKGSFASAASFEFICMLVYIANVVFCILKRFKVNVSKK